MSKPDLKVVQIYDSNMRDPAATLRVIADEIEAGKYGAVGSAAVVIMGDKLQIFGMGIDHTGPSIALLLAAAHSRFARDIEGHGEDT